MKPIKHEKYKLNSTPVLVKLFNHEYTIDIFAVGYAEGGTCIMGTVRTGPVDCVAGEPFGKLSFWQERVTQDLPPEEFCVKTWSENRWAASVFKSGLFEDTGKRIVVAYGEAPIWKLSSEVIARLGCD